MPVVPLRHGKTAMIQALGPIILGIWQSIYYRASAYFRQLKNRNDTSFGTDNFGIWQSIYYRASAIEAL